MSCTHYKQNITNDIWCLNDFGLPVYEREETQPRCSDDRAQHAGSLSGGVAETDGGGEYFHTALRREREPRDGGEERMALDVAHATAS